MFLLNQRSDFHLLQSEIAAGFLWLDAKTVLLGTGVRTNAEAARQLATFLKDLDVELIATPLPAKSQHLLGVINFVDSHQTVVHGGKITAEMGDILTTRNIKTIFLPEDDEINNRLAMNFVTLAPGKIVMPAGAPNTKAKLMAHGIEAHEIDISEYLKGAGGLACLTGILRRQ